MSVEIRVRAPEEAVLFDRTLTASFGEEPGPGDSEHVVDPERDVAAYDGSQMVGTASAFPFELTIPRGSLAAESRSSPSGRAKARTTVASATGSRRSTGGSTAHAT